MRDPWFPIALMLIVVLAVWLGIVGPMPSGVAAWLQQWQSVTALLIAGIGAYIAIRNTNLSLKHAAGLESNRRNRKHAAVRAVLPLALTQVTSYAERSVRALNGLINSCNQETLPQGTAPASIVQPLPSETLKTLAEFIEYSDSINVGIVEATVAVIQIHDSRLHGLHADNHDPSGTRVVVRSEIEGLIIDAASIYAGAAAVFEYARRRKDRLPDTLSWDDVGAALRNMKLWDDQHPRLYQNLTRREGLSAGPFARLNRPT